MLGGAGVGTGAHHRNGGFAAGLRHHVLHRTHQKIRGEHPAQTGGDDLIPRMGLGAALQIGQGAQAVRCIGGIAVQNAVFPGAGYHARRVEAGVQNGHHLAAGRISLYHHAQQIAPVTDDRIVHRYAVCGALVQREAAELVQRVAANDKAGHIGGIAVLFLNVGQCLVGLVFSLDAVIIHHLLTQLGVFRRQLLVLFHDLVDAGIFFPHRAHTAADHSPRLLEGGQDHAQQFLRGSGQASVGTGIGHDAHQKHRHGHENLEFPSIKKIFQRVLPSCRDARALPQAFA